MLDHHLQRSIVYRLALARSLRFSELKPAEIENKLFTYHLKKVMSAGYVAKDVQGAYVLTASGRRLGVRVFDNEQSILDRPESVLFLVIRRKDGAWLLYSRLAHPLRGRTGFMHAKPNASESVTDTARQTLKNHTGLEASFHALGGGFFRVYQDGKLESFTNFTLLIAEDIKGELQPHDEHAMYAWHEKPDFSDKDMLPNMSLLVELCRKSKLFFIEHTFDLP